MKILYFIFPILIITITGCNEINVDQAAPILNEIEKIEEIFAETTSISQAPVNTTTPTKEKITKILGCPNIDIVEVKETPDINSPVVDWLIKGTCVSLDQRTDDNKWVRIYGLDKAISNPGWVLVSELLLSGKLEDLWAIYVR